MTVETQEFAGGDLDYVDKLNLLHEAIVELQGLGEGGLSPDSFTAMSVGLFGGDNACLIGTDSYNQSTATTVLTIGSGEAYLPDDTTYVQSTGDTDIDFNGFSANTYYVHIDPETGDPYADLLTDEDYIYEVVWSGSTFTSVTLTAEVVPAFADWSGLTDGVLWEQTYDTFVDRIDAIEAMAALLQVATVTGSTLTVTESQALQQSATLFSGTPGVSCTVTLPDQIRQYLVLNDIDDDLVFTAGAGDNVTVPQGCMGLLYTDGNTNVVGILVIAMSGDEFVGGEGGGGGGVAVSETSVYHPISVFIGGGTGDGLTYLQAVFSHTVLLPEDLPNSYARARVAATSETIFTIKKIDILSNETELGTITFDAGATNGTIAFSAEATITEGIDRFIIEGPATADASLEDISISISGLKSATKALTMASFVPTVLSDGQYLYYGTPTHDFTIPSGGANCYAVSITAATASAAIAIKKNGAQVGSLTFGAGTTEATVSVPSDVSFIAGTDIISFEGPATADSTLSGVSVSVRGTRDD